MTFTSPRQAALAMISSPDRTTPLFCNRQDSTPNGNSAKLTNASEHVSQKSAQVADTACSGNGRKTLAFSLRVRKGQP
jgi:uncharacterized protein YgbK (DUF1537 family)